MFTGLVETTGRISAPWSTASGQRLSVATRLAAELRLGDSIAVSGVCLTVSHVDADTFAADVSPETLRVTTLGALTPGRLVNLERPLRADARLGGHFVLGHVDAVGLASAMRSHGDHYWLDVDVPASVLPFVVLKGSIAIDGISLTVAALAGHRLGVQIIPFTHAHTSLLELHDGDTLNLEADVIGKYVARLLSYPSASESAHQL